jgi:hypothetical protein
MRSRLFSFGLVCMVLGWNLPNHYPPYPSFHGEFLAAIALVVLAAATALSTGAVPNALQPSGPSTVVLALPRVVWVMAVLALIPLAQLAMGKLAFRADAGFGLIYALGAASAVYVGCLWATQVGREAALRSLFATLVVGAVVANSLAFAQWLRLSDLGWWAMELIGTRPYGNLAQSNHFGLLMMLGTVATVALFELRSIRSVPVFGLLVGYLGWGILMSQSRAAALALALVVACWWLTRHRAETRLWRSAVVGAFALWLVMFLQFDGIQDLVLPTGYAGRDRLDAGVRPAMWHHFATAIVAHPWVGYGFNQGVAAMAEVATQLHPSATRSTVYAHNFLLDFAVWFGIPVALVVGGGLAFWLLGWLRASGDAGWQQHRHLVFAVWLSLVTQSLLEYPYAYAYFLVPCCLLAGVVGVSNAKPASGRIAPALSGWILWGVAVVLLGAIVRDYSYLEEDFRQARFARANYQDRPEHAYLQNPWVLDLLARHNSSALQEIKPGMSLNEIEEMRAIARRIQNPAVQLDYAKALALNSRGSDAQHELAILRSIYAPDVFAAIHREWESWLIDNAPRTTTN